MWGVNMILENGSVVYHKSGIKGSISKVELWSIPKKVFIKFEEPVAGSRTACYREDQVGTYIFLSLEDYEQTYSINNELNRITLAQRDQLLRDHKIDYNTLENWSNTFKFIKDYPLNYGSCIDKDIIYLRYYYPKTTYGGYSLNPEFDDYSNLILRLKDSNLGAIEYFFEILDNLLAKNIILCSVPSSIPNKNSGMQNLVKLLSEENRIDATECLLRHTQVDKLSYGGNREISIHLNSIRVDYEHLIEGKEVLLLDDVLTSGNSMRACKQLLYESGVEKVRCLVLGKTHR